MNKIKRKQYQAKKRKARVRGKTFGTKSKPRLSVFRSNKHIYLQVINDQEGKTLAAENTLSLSKKQKKSLSGTKLEQAGQVSKALGESLKDKKIKKLRFDRGSARYHGRVKAVAESLRKQGIEI